MSQDEQLGREEPHDPSRRRSVGRRERVELPADGDPNGRLLVDIDDREALAEVLGDNTWPRADF